MLFMRDSLMSLLFVMRDAAGWFLLNVAFAGTSKHMSEHTNLQRWLFIPARMWVMDTLAEGLFSQKPPLNFGYF